MNKERFIETLKSKLDHWINSKWILTLFFLSLVILVISKSVLRDSQQELPIHDEPFSADTVIPAGFSLVPIDLINRDSLSSLIGPYGLVDLFLPSEEGGKKKGVRVASGVKILRAPLNPDLFAVLVRDEAVGPLLGATGPYYAVVLNPNQEREAPVLDTTKKTKPTEKVEYYEGNL